MNIEETELQIMRSDNMETTEIVTAPDFKRSNSRRIINDIVESDDMLETSNININSPSKRRHRNRERIQYRECDYMNQNNLITSENNTKNPLNKSESNSQLPNIKNTENPYLFNSPRSRMARNQSKVLEDNNNSDDSRSMVSINSNINMSLLKFKMNNKKRDTFVKTSDTSSDSIRINFNEIDFISMKNNKTTNFYNMEQLNGMEFIEIYNILISVSYLIFIDNAKLIKKSSCLNLLNCFGKKHLIDTEFPGCTFFPFESIDIIWKNIHTLNNNILNADYNTQKIYIKDDICYGINFDNGEIMKNCLYKKMEITGMIIFIPIDKYNIKQTEYKIRGFCQIVEELGAKTIDITFKKNNILCKKKSIEMMIGSEINMIAGNLGLGKTNTDMNEETYNYTLSYPSNNSIILNENIIKKKIKRKKFIISESIYNSNMELQYLVHSRCRHMINKYSTVFTFDNNSTIDEKFFINLKSHGIDIGINYKQYVMNKDYLSIVTDVVFSTINDNIISGNNISLDSNGFTFLMESLLLHGDFENKGIYKIITFLNEYIETKLKYSQTKQYKIVNNIIKNIKKLLTLKEYGELLCNYFSITSQWIHFKNFIDLLSNKTQSYDKLGYIIIVSNNNITIEEKIETMLRFIQQKCIILKIEDKFWHMIQPNNFKLNNEMKNKLLYDYDFIQYYNWYNLNMLIKHIESYTIDFTGMDNSMIFSNMITNMNIGYKYWEFYNNIVPFIVKQLYTMHNIMKDDIYLTTSFEKSINIETFISLKINTTNDLYNYIGKKISRIKKINQWVESLEYPSSIENLCTIINSTNFNDTYDHINKKIINIMTEKTVENLKEWIGTDEITKNIMYKIINKIICYNEKINIIYIPSNYIGFMIVYNNFINGISKIEFEKTIKPFISKHITDKKILEIILEITTCEFFNMFCKSYYDMFIYFKNIIEALNMDSSSLIDDFIF